MEGPKLFTAIAIPPEGVQAGVGDAARWIVRKDSWEIADLDARCQAHRLEWWGWWLAVVLRRGGRVCSVDVWMTRHRPEWLIPGRVFPFWTETVGGCFRIR